LLYQNSVSDVFPQMLYFRVYVRKKCSVIFQSVENFITPQVLKLDDHKIKLHYFACKFSSSTDA